MLGVTAGLLVSSPITNYIASETSIEMAMLFFAIVNAMAFIATLLFVPSMPVNERLSYGTQVSVLKKPITWLAIATVVFIGSSQSSVNSFIAEYLETITNISGKSLSLVLFLLGLASLAGNLVGGKLLTKNAMKTVTTYPIVLAIFYVMSFLTGKSTIPMILTVMVWGMLFAIGGMINQFWITSAAQEAPDFANGLFLSCGNLGITFGTAVGGLFISGMGIQYIVLGGLLFLLLSLASIVMSRYMYSPTSKQLAS